MTIYVFVTVLLLLSLYSVALVLIVFVACLAREATSDLWTTAWKQPPRPVRTILPDLWILIGEAWRRARHTLHL